MRSVLYILGSLSDEDVGWFVGNGEKLPLSAGAPLVVEGESLDAIYIVLEGTLRVHRKGAADSFAQLQAGELVGELVGGITGAISGGISGGISDS